MDRRTLIALALALLVVFAAFTALQARYATEQPVRRPAADSTLVVRDSDARRPSAGAAAGGAGAAGRRRRRRRSRPRGRPCPRRPGAALGRRDAALPRRVLEPRRAARRLRAQALRLRREPTSTRSPRCARSTARTCPRVTASRWTARPRSRSTWARAPRPRSLADTMFAVTESTDAAGAMRALTFTARDSGGDARAPDVAGAARQLHCSTSRSRRAASRRRGGSRLLAHDALVAALTESTRRRTRAACARRAWSARTCTATAPALVKADPRCSRRVALGRRAEPLLPRAGRHAGAAAGARRGRDRRAARPTAEQAMILPPGTKPVPAASRPRW